jgi:hypothetical protein
MKRIETSPEVVVLHSGFQTLFSKSCAGNQSVISRIKHGAKLAMDLLANSGVSPNNLELDKLLAWLCRAEANHS